MTVPRPLQFDELCFISYKETTVPNSIRTTMSSGTVKVRRRTTGLIYNAEGTYLIPETDIAAFHSWLMDDCEGLTLPTYFKRPNGVDQPYRVTEPPVYIYGGTTAANMCKVTLKLENLPQWI